MLPLITTLYVLFYLAIVIGFFYLIYTWAMRYFKLKEEQNQILREIANKLDAKP